MGIFDKSGSKVFSLLGCMIVLLSIAIIIDIPHATAQEYEFNEIKGKDIATDPVAQKILKQIELSKKILADLQKGPQIVITEQQKYVAEQRAMAQAKLDAELQRMNKQYEDYTPENAFASYVANKPEYMHAFYWDQFNYLNSKVSNAKEKRDLVIANGGTFSQAQQAFIKHATFPKSEVKAVFNELVERHNLDDYYSGTLDADKWYPKEAVSLYESWGEQKNQKVAIKNFTKPVISVQTNKISIVNAPIQSISLTTSTNTVPASEFDDSGAMNLDGNNYNEINGNILNGATEFTASAWINPDYKKGSSKFTVLEKPGVFKLTINNYIQPRHIAEFSVYDGIKWNTVKSFSPIDENWTHVAGVLEDSSLGLYVDGNLEGVYQMSGSITLNSKGIIERGPLVIKDSSEPINIGVQKITKFDEQIEKNYFSGQISDVLVDDSALSITEIYNDSSI